VLPNIFKDNKLSISERVTFLCGFPLRLFFAVCRISGMFLRWLNTVFDTYVSFTFFSKTLDPSIAKNGSKEVNNTNIGFLMVKLTYVPLPWQHE